MLIENPGLLLQYMCAINEAPVVIKESVFSFLPFPMQHRTVLQQGIILDKGNKN